MPVEVFTVKNVKCGGCVSTIQDGLKGLAGVSEVAVRIDNGEVTVHGEGLDREALSARLAELGYPEAR